MKVNLYSAIIGFILLTNISIAQTPGDEDREMLNKGKARDQKEIDEALKGWWTASMKNHDRRIQWWREAKFGMFIHWGVYSLPGGEWKGKKVSGYAEHLMRKEKISRAEYLELAHIFNPVKFNAEEWVRNAKAAGMKYMIITAKHHDGFALYPSAVSDFDINDQTPFKRDPMAELSAACKKYGLKFGFYYSHAFDWEHPQAPGNDWEYKNPGGDLNLFGGREWHDLHPELLTKAQKYVNEKAIPQIKELLVKYRPDILWFDTPQKLPLSENIKILKAIRETDHDVVVNGRLVRFASSNFGDYKNTADRPAEFYPVTGDWEAIPTTNESYGYHKFDSSHKPVAHFIQLIASAASRGGNLLMNIGPKGDGTFDIKDVNILKGIGKWMDKNGESIYGRTATSLPLQSWGVSTLKNNKMYLHIFHWPADGKLYVGGLKSNIGKVYLLSDPKKAFASKRINANDWLINLPKKAIDAANTVLVLELKNNIVTDSLRFVSTNIPVTRLLAFDAIQGGKGFGFGDGKTDRYYVEGWKTKEQGISWNFRTIEPGNFKVLVKYIAPKETAGGKYAFNLDGHYVHHYVQTTEKNTTVTTAEIYNAFLTAGTHSLKIDPVHISKTELMKLLEVQLIPIQFEKIQMAKIFSEAEQQNKVMLKEIPIAKAANSGAKGVTPGSSGELVSPRTLDSMQLKLVPSRDWTSGFYPGNLWYLYEYTGKKEWKEEAQKFTAKMEREKTNATTHDMGFKVYCSFGNGYRLTNDQHYKEVIIESAKTLATRFNAKIGSLRSWDHNRNRWDFPVIIDNMMNLELLFEASKLSGDRSLYNIAVTHANTTMKNHYRPDHSSYHVVDYDTITGQVRKKNTAQGYKDESSWGRGQAWGLYGFTLCYRETKDPAYLKHAENIAGFLLHHPHFPKDGVMYWDFDAPNIPDELRDVSGTAVMASALYELSTYSKNSEYRKAADKIMESLTRYYRSPIGENKGFILLHSVRAKPTDDEVDVPLIYADYYYLEALLRMKKLNEGKKLFAL
jgi:alpha-L-fucosidase/rhamnogalacturonyl hydrolase YesR